MFINYIKAFNDNYIWTIENDGNKNGRVIFLNSSILPQPSTLAASYSSLGIFCRLANISIEQNGITFHATTIATTNKVVVMPLVHSIGFSTKPIFINSLFINPYPG